ncbi:MAG TPA: hypothetical protein VG826_27630 [Pirellulales bacterium]|nr:hypothetical protein [Pirellulales bacterium]
MNLPFPFAYPARAHKRLHGPKGYTDYGSYKPFLRDEFAFRCVFCLERELWYPNRAASFSVEHFAPKSTDAVKECDYENLFYACVRCNSFKQTKITRLDPTRVAYADHFRVDVNGLIEGLSNDAKKLIDVLHLNDPPALDQRQMILELLKLKQQHPHDNGVNSIFLSRFKYPEDLPNLALLKPKENTRPEGIKASHFARRSRNELPDVY